MKKIKKDRVISDFRFQISRFNSLKNVVYKPMRFLKPHRFVAILPPSLATFLAMTFLLILLFSNCQPPSKGCLDARATNFDVTATQACEDNCCTYPNLTLQTDYIIDGISKLKLKFDDTTNLRYKYNFKLGDDSIRIIGSQFYLSGFQLVTSDNKIAKTIDSTLLYRQKDTIRTLSNYALVGRNNGFDFKIGSFSQSGKFSKLQFTVGLDAEANKTDPTKMPSSHPLSTQRDSMYLKKESTYIFNKLTVEKWRSQSKKDTLRFFITSPQNVVITKDMSFKEGFDVAIPLTINYAKLIEGVNFSGDENTIKAKIVSNYDKVFSLNF
jgi:hypothetical protein